MIWLSVSENISGIQINVLVNMLSKTKGACRHTTKYAIINLSLVINWKAFWYLLGASVSNFILRLHSILQNSRQIINNIHQYQASGVKGVMSYTYLGSLKTGQGIMPITLPYNREFSFSWKMFDNRSFHVLEGINWFTVWTIWASFPTNSKWTCSRSLSETSLMIMQNSA